MSTRNETETDSFQHLKSLVEALESAFISSWQSTAAWQKQLDEAREFIDLKTDVEKLYE